MTHKVLVKAIHQVDNHCFAIHWSDDLQDIYRLSELQGNCPCAGCVDEAKRKQVQENVRAVTIRNVGRYALQIQFTSGCSSGVYSFELLRHLSKQRAKRTCDTI